MSSSSQRVYLHLGTNLGDRLEHLHYAHQQIAMHLGQLIQYSAIYETAAWGNLHQPDFLNQVIVLETNHPPADVLERCLQIEKARGRERLQKWSARILDIDLLFYANQIIQTPQLTLPHPQLHLRNFVLVPLLDVAPDFVHPVLQRTIRELYEDCPDTLAVNSYQ